MEHLLPCSKASLYAALKGEMDAHLSDEERLSGNRRNGKMHKQVQTSMGEVTVSTPRHDDTIIITYGKQEA